MMKLFNPKTRSHLSGVLFASSLMVACSDGGQPGPAAAHSPATEDRPRANGSQPANTAVPGELDALLESLAAGASSLSIEGTVTSTGEYTTAEDPRYGGVSVDVFRPARGGGAARTGTNAGGPYQLTIYTDAIHQRDPDNVVRAWIDFVLPPGAQGGETYTLAAFRDAEDNEVQAHVRGDGSAWTFGRQVSGHLHVIELGEHIRAAWQLEAADGVGEQALRVKAQGAVNALPLTRQSEAEYTLASNGEATPHFARITGRPQGERRMLVIGNGIYLYIPQSLSPGTHPVLDRNEAQAVRAQFTSHDVDTVEGRFTLREGADGFDADLEITTGGADNLVLRGTLRGFALD